MPASTRRRSIACRSCWGLPFLLALYTAIRQNPLQLQGVSDNDLFVRGWFWISFVLVYLPVDYQIHMLNGWQVPIAILATRGDFRLSGACAGAATSADAGVCTAVGDRRRRRRDRFLFADESLFVCVAIL